jgi:hypothetical protein
VGRQILTVVSFITFQLMILAGQADAGVPAPVPAPAAIVLIGVGAAAVGLIAWWRSSRK